MKALLKKLIGSEIGVKLRESHIRKEYNEDEELVAEQEYSQIITAILAGIDDNFMYLIIENGYIIAVSHSNINTWTNDPETTAAWMGQSMEALVESKGTLN